MGSTTKIIFSSFLAISIVVMFLIFSMQKSAQLTLDITDIEHTVQKKDEIISNIQQKLQTAEASAERATTKNAEIPTLQASIDTIENEKLAYKQQIDELQNNLQIQLEKASNQLSDFANLQKSYEEQQLVLTETEKAKTAADLLTTQTAEELEAMQTSLAERDEEIGQSLTDLEQKDQAISFYKEKIDAAAEEIAIMKTVHSSGQMNLALILDDLSSKTHTVAELTNKIQQLTGSKTLAGDGLTHPKQKTISTVTVIEDLINRLNLENAPPEEDVLLAAMAEIEDLKVTNGLLRSSGNEQSALIENLKTTIETKENEITDTIKQSHEIAIPLTERITLLEFQLEEAININSNVSDDLNTAQNSNTELANLNNALNTDLESSQATLEEALQQIAQLSDGLKTAEADSQQKESNLLSLSEEKKSLSEEMESAKLAIAEAAEQYDTLKNQSAALETELANKDEAAGQQAEQLKTLQDQVKEQAEQLGQQAEQLKTLQEQLTQQTATLEETDTLKKELEQFPVILAEKELAIETLTTQLAENSTTLSSLQADLDQTKTQTTEQQNATLEQEERIAKLLEEVAAAKAMSDEQTEKLQSTEAQLATLEEKAAGTTATLEEKIQPLEASLAENQTEILALQASITSLTKERDQLLLNTTDSDNDGVSDADDSCPDTPQDAKVNAEGCEEDTDKDGLVNRLDLCPETGSGSSVDSAGCSEEQTIVVLEGISFQFGTAELTEDASPALNSASIILQNNPDINMEIAGHTDSVGEKETNLQLSTLRAQAVMSYLVSSGVAADRLQAKGYGADEPIADNATKIGRSQNRRVELRRIETPSAQ